MNTFFDLSAERRAEIVWTFARWMGEGVACAIEQLFAGNRAAFDLLRHADQEEARALGRNLYGLRFPTILSLFNR